MFFDIFKAFDWVRIEAYLLFELKKIVLAPLQLVIKFYLSSYRFFVTVTHFIPIFKLKQGYPKLGADARKKFGGRVENSVF